MTPRLRRVCLLSSSPTVLSITSQEEQRTPTSIFLCAIADSKYANIVTLLQAQVSSFCNSNDDGYLPHHLHLSCIATVIITNAKARMRDLATPHINKAFGMGSDWDTAFGSIYDWDADKIELPYYHVQGYTPRVHRLDQGRNRTDRDQADNGRDCDRDRNHGANRGRHEFDQRHDFGSHDLGPPCPGARGQGGGRAGDAPQGHSLCLDLRRRPFLPGVICTVCIQAMRLQAVTCSRLRFSLTPTRINFQNPRNRKSRRNGLPAGGIKLANPLALPDR